MYWYGHATWRMSPTYEPLEIGLPSRGKGAARLACQAVLKHIASGCGRVVRGIVKAFHVVGGSGREHVSAVL